MSMRTQLKRCHALCALRGRARDQRGQSLVEFVLALPILLVIVFGIIEFASAWRTYQVVTNVAREAARFGVVPTTTSIQQIEDRVDTLLVQSGLRLNTGRTRTVTCAGGGSMAPASCAAGDPVQVDLTYQHQFVVLGPALNLMCSGCGTGYGTLTLGTTSIMRRE